MHFHGLDDVVLERFLFEDFRGSRLEFVSQFDRVRVDTEQRDFRALESSSFLRYDREIVRVSREVVAVHSCFESTSNQILTLIDLNGNKKRFTT